MCCQSWGEKGQAGGPGTCLASANHPHPVATLCSSFSRENGHLKCSFAHHDTHQPAVLLQQLVGGLNPPEKY